MEFAKAEDKKLWEKVMLPSIMSSDDSGTDDGEEVLVTHPLRWRTSKVDNFFSSLDQAAKQAKSSQALRQRKKRVIGGFSDRKVPAGLPKWATQ